MKYCVIDKCYNINNTWQLNINYCKNEKIGTTLRPIKNNDCTNVSIGECYTKDVCEEYSAYNANHTLVNCNISEEMDNNVFQDLYCSDIINYYNGELYSLTKSDDKNIFTSRYIKKLVGNSMKYPTIVFEWKISTSCDKYYDYCRPTDKITDNINRVIKRSNIEDDIDIQITPKYNKIVEYESMDKIKNIHLNYSIETKISGSTELIHNGEKYLFKPSNITDMLCICTDDDDNNYTWTFLCIARLVYVFSPKVITVTEKQFKELDKHNADIIVFNNITFLLKNTSNNNFVSKYNFDYDRIKCKNIVDIDHPENCKSTCRNCNNCYECRDCSYCNNCRFCDNCFNCDTCDKCNYCLNNEKCVNSYNTSDMTSLNDYKSDVDKSCNIDVYKQYISQYIETDN